MDEVILFDVGGRVCTRLGRDVSVACTDIFRRRDDVSAYITFGGLITLIARYMGMNLSSLQPSTLSFYYDMSTLMGARLIEKVVRPNNSECFHWLSGVKSEHH